LRLVVLPDDGIPRSTRQRRSAVHGCCGRRHRKAYVAGAGCIDGAGERLILALRLSRMGGDVSDHLSAQARRAAVSDALLTAALTLAAAAAFTLWLSRPAHGQTDPLARGRGLYVVGCSSCHGANGTGVTTSDDKQRGPSLQNAGEAAAFYELSTGR